MMQLFKDSGGQLSSVRASMFLCVLGAIGLGFYGIAKGVDITSLGILCGGFLAAGIGGKVYQKGRE